MALISMRDFSFAFPGSQQILRNVSLTIEEGSFTVLLGPNGSGKTTLLQQLHPVLAAHGDRTGEILWRGKNVSRETSDAVASRIGFVMQRPESQIVTDKVWHELAFGLENQGLGDDVIRRKVAEIATYFGIEEWFDKDVSELSGGQRQILNLASVMVLNPELLILDEPTAQLDPISADNFIQMLHRLNYELGVTILAAEHEVQKILPFASAMVVLTGGKISAAGAPRDIIPDILKHNPSLASAMPVAAQLYWESHSAASRIPLTVGEGKRWLKSVGGDGAVAETAAGTATSVTQSTTSKGEGVTVPETPVTLSARDVWFRYDKNSPDLVKGLNLHVHEGEIFALVGANGSGKSTLVSLLSGVNSPYRGRIELGGTRIERIAPRELYRNFLGVLPQDPQTLFVQKTVAADLKDVAKRRRRKDDRDELRLQESIERGAEALGLMHVLERHPYDLSGGEQQLAALLKVLLLRPRILLLDEPTKGMDEVAKQRVIDIFHELQRQKVTTVFVTHDVEFAARAADRAGMFFNGDVVSVDRVHPFFSTNNFYTTSASRIARDRYPDAITKDEVIACLTRANS